MIHRQTIFIHGVNKIEHFLDDFISVGPIMILIQQYRMVVSLNGHVLNKSLRKRFVIPLEVGLCYIFYPYRYASLVLYDVYYYW